MAGGGETSPLVFEAMGSGGGGCLVVVVCHTGRACLRCPVVIALLEPKNQIKTLVS